MEVHAMARMVSAAKLLFMGCYLALWPVLILALAGDWRWVAGWIFNVWFVSVCVTTVTWLFLKDPALLAERFRRPGTGGQTRGDALIVYGLAIGFIVWIAVMPLDARRFHWTRPLPLLLNIVGGVFLMCAWLFMVRSFTDNPFLSPLVRIQNERGHRVVSTGVYGVVRHPMYLAAVLMFVGAPLLTGSAVALITGALLTLLLAIRIVNEERLLTIDLRGYEEYRHRVRYRLVPFIW
jgi:protein-S-isoprenylcysteine O-methyltransferase Ste14